MEVSSIDDNGLELGLGLGLKRKEEDSRILVDSSCSSSCSVNVSKTSSVVGTKRTAPVSPNSTSVVGWPPIRKAQRTSILANRKHATNGNIHLSVKVNMDGTLIGRKVDLYAHTSYEMLAHTLEDMFYGTRSNTEGIGFSSLLNESSEFVLTYEDKDGDCMLVGDVPWQMFLGSVKRLRILRNPKMHT